MNNELEKLRPEVRNAVVGADKAFNHTGLFAEPYWQTIRAELLRLTDDCARLVDCINAQPPTRRSLIDRAERAEAELATAQNTINAQQDMMGALKQKLALSEGELAALKTRTEGAIDMGCVVECFLGSRCGRIINPFTPPKWIGKRVRLVVEE